MITEMFFSKFVSVLSFIEGDFNNAYLYSPSYHQDLYQKLSSLLDNVSLYEVSNFNPLTIEISNPDFEPHQWEEGERHPCNLNWPQEYDSDKTNFFILNETLSK